MRLISSNEPQPTSPDQISRVPGRNVKRNGLRNPYAMIRRRRSSASAMAGLPAAALPVSGSSRRIEPFSETGCPAGRRKPCERSAPPCELGAVSPVQAGPGGSPHGLSVCPKSARSYEAPSPALM